MPLSTSHSPFPDLPESIAGLTQLAENLWWSWRPRARMLFKMINRQAWKESGHNPDKMLREIDPAILKQAAANPDYLRHYHVVMSLLRITWPVGDARCWMASPLPRADPSLIFRPNSVCTDRCRFMPVGSVFWPAIS